VSVTIGTGADKLCLQLMTIIQSGNAHWKTLQQCSATSQHLLATVDSTAAAEFSTTGLLVQDVLKVK
jgi:hypothetical protein